MRNLLPFVLAQAGIHPLIYGMPGGGKSAIARAVAKHLGIPYLRVDLSCRSEIEVQGAAMPTDLPETIWSGGEEYRLTDLEKGCQAHVGDKCLLWVRPEWAYLAHTRRCLVVLEELLSCPSAVHAAALQTLSERTVGGLPLHPETMIVAITNYQWCGTNMHEVGASLANRLCHLNWDDGENRRNWEEGLMAGGKFPEPRVPTLNGWRKDVSAVGALMVAARRNIPSLVMNEKQAQGEKVNLTRGWPSDRSLYNAVCAIAACRSVGVAKELEMEAVSGLIGNGPAMELYQYWDQQDLPNAEELMQWLMNDLTGAKQKTDFPVGSATYSKKFQIPKRLDVTYTTMLQVRAAWEREQTIERMRGLLHYLNLLSAKHPDVVASVLDGSAGDALITYGDEGLDFPKEFPALLPLQMKMQGFDMEK